MSDVSEIVEPDIDESNVSEYLAEGDYHRFIFKPLLLKNKNRAKVGEFVVDQDNGIVYTVDKNKKLHSKAKEAFDRLSELEGAGIIQSALAFEHNAQVYTVYIRNNKCLIDVMLKFNKYVRYYAIRTLSNDNISYITGQLVEERVENVLVDVLPYTDDPQIVFSGVAQTGMLHSPQSILDDHPYYIDLFDKDRYVIGTVPCQLKRSSQLSFSQAPEKNITALEISTNQDMIEKSTLKNVSFLYKGQAFNTLNIYVSAVYANGDKRYINHDLASSRLIINYPEEIDNETVGSSFEIHAKYYTEELNTGEHEVYDDANFASIDAIRKVVIVDDIFIGVKYLFPVPVVKTIEGGAKSIQLHTFAFYENDTIVDVSNNSRLASTNFFEESFGVIQTFNMSLGIGHGGTTYTESAIKINMDDVQHGKWVILDVPNAPQNNYPCCIARFDPVSNPGQIRMALLRSTNEIFANSTAFATIGAIEKGDGTVIPTHFRVRSVIDSSFMHTIEPIPISQYNEFTIIDTNLVANKLAGYTANNNSIPYPVLIEFYRYNESTHKYLLLSVYPFITQMVVFTQVTSEG